MTFNLTALPVCCHKSNETTGNVLCSWIFSCLSNQIKFVCVIFKEKQITILVFSVVLQQFLLTVLNFDFLLSEAEGRMVVFLPLFLFMLSWPLPSAILLNSKSPTRSCFYQTMFVLVTKNIS